MVGIGISQVEETNNDLLLRKDDNWVQMQVEGEPKAKLQNKGAVEIYPNLFWAHVKWMKNRALRALQKANSS